MKYLPLWALILREQKSITPTMHRVRMVMGISSEIMLTSTDTMVMTLDTSWGMLWLIIWRRVSTSLVYTDMMSPWGWVSK